MIEIKKQITIKLKNGKNQRINNMEEYNNFYNSKLYLDNIKNVQKEICIDYKKRIIEINKFNKNIKFNFNNIKEAIQTFGLIKENLIEEQYKYLDIKNKIVVDIGANIGDCAIYFALKGAKHVYAFEPYPYSYKIAKKNIIINNLENKITILNVGVGGKKKEIKIDETYENCGRSDLKEFKKGKIIQITTLKDIVNRFNIKQDAGLKIDCEGCEYETIISSDEATLKKFNKIIIEYHYGYKNLVNKLKNIGFKVNYTFPIYGFNPYAENKNMYVGLIYAKKRRISK